MITEAQVRDALHQVLDPEIGRPIDELGMLEGVGVQGDRVTVDVLLTIAGCPLQDRITGDVKAAPRRSGVTDVEVRMRPMSEEQRATLVGDAPRDPGSLSSRRPSSPTARRR